MKRKITANLAGDELILHVPLDLLTTILQPRVIYALGLTFTKREREVLKGLIRGLSNKEIGNELNLSERTIKFYVSSLFVKTKTKSRFDLQSLYAANGESK